MAMYIGVDISKDFFDCAYHSDDKVYHKQFSNTPKGFSAAVAWAPEHAHWVMEATGPYFIRFASHLNEHEHLVSVINPAVIKSFARMELSSAKNDKQDAMLIARYGELTQPSVWQRPSAVQTEIKGLCALLDDLIKTRSEYHNRLHASEHSGQSSKFIKKELKTMIKRLDKRIDRVEIEMVRLLKEAYNEAFMLAQTIPGVGVKTAANLIASTDGLKHFDTAKQLVSYAGLAAKVDQSGNRKHGNRSITKRGQGRLRSLLYMGSWTAQSCNPACKALADRLRAKGKPAKQIKIAVAAKLLRQLFGVIKSGQPFSEKMAFGA